MRFSNVIFQNLLKAYYTLLTHILKHHLLIKTIVNLNNTKYSFFTNEIAHNHGLFKIPFSHIKI